jgi:hypothetical protein
MVENYKKTEKYKRENILAVDFDGTCVYPKDIKSANFGELDVPHAVRVLHRFVKERWKIVLWTCRNQEFLPEAVQWFADRNIPLMSTNVNSVESMHPNYRAYFDREGSSPKVFANLYVDDRNIHFYDMAYVDWLEVERVVFGDNKIGVH